MANFFRFMIEEALAAPVVSFYFPLEWRYSSD